MMSFRFYVHKSSFWLGFILLFSGLGVSQEEPPISPDDPAGNIQVPDLENPPPPQVDPLVEQANRPDAEVDPVAPLPVGDEASEINSEPTAPPTEQVKRPEVPATNQPPPDVQVRAAKDSASTTDVGPASTVPTIVVGANERGAKNIPTGEELVNIDFPEPTEIKDIIKAVALWTGKNVLFDTNVNGRIQLISPRKVTKVEAYQAFLSALNMLDLTTVETGKVIKIIPVRKAVKDNLRTYYGKEWAPSTDNVITQIVPLKYIDAKTVQATLTRVFSSGSSIVSFPETNTLIITDSGYKIKHLLEIIDMLDVKTQQPQLSIVPIRYSDAKSVVDKVNEIFRAQGQGKRKTSDYGTYKVMVEERSNSVIVFGPPRTIEDIKLLIRQLDIQVDDPSRQASIHVRLLDYANAKKLAATLTSIAPGGNTAKGRRPTYIPPSLGRSPSNAKADSPISVADFGDNVKITADESTNALLITGSRAAYRALNSIIRKLDIRRSQVYVEADILDLATDNGFRFGSSVVAGAAKANGSGTRVATAWQAGSGIGPLIVASADANANKSASSSAAAAGVFAQDLTIGILSGKEVSIPGIGKFSPGALIRMIKTDTNTKVIASPHLLTANNEEASISVGQKIFIRTAGDLSAVAGIAQPKIEDRDVDLTLNLTPNISHSNYVTMKIKIESNSLLGQEAEQGLPKISKRTSNTIVTVKNSQTVVISGLEQTSESEVFSKIPLLGDIPIIGWLFRNSDIKKTKNNLTIFLTPHIVHGAEDLAAIYKRKTDERNEYLEAIYGSSFSESEFYRLIPGAKEGEFREDEIDALEKKQLEDTRKSLYEDINSTTDQPMPNAHVDEERNLTIPDIGMPGGGGGFSDPGDISTGGSGQDFDAGGEIAPPMGDLPPPPEPMIDGE